MGAAVDIGRAWERRAPAHDGGGQPRAVDEEEQPWGELAARTEVRGIAEDREDKPKVLEAAAAAASSTGEDVAEGGAAGADDVAEGERGGEDVVVVEADSGWRRSSVSEEVVRPVVVQCEDVWYQAGQDPCQRVVVLYVKVKRGI